MAQRTTLLLACVLLLAGSQLSAQTYTVDQVCTIGFEDISTTGTALNLTDDSEANVTSPFAFTFFGITSSDLRVGNNGGILYNATAGDVGFGNAAFPTAQNLIAPFWDDLDDENGNVFHQVLGTAPLRRLIIQWEDRPHFSGFVGADGATFQVVLYEFTNVIEFRYDDVLFGSGFDNGASATVGINATGVGFTQTSFNTPSLFGVPCLRFVPDVLPANDDCASASTLVEGQNVFDSFMASGTDLSSCATADNNDVWFTYTATDCGQLALSTCGLTDIVYSISAFDACAGAELACTDNAACPTDGISVALVDGQTVLIRLGDISGNQGSGFLNATFTIDPVEPICQNITVQLDVNGAASITAAQIDNGTTYACGIASMALDFTDFDCSDVGTVDVQLTVTANNGQSGSCTATVTVEDNIDPVITCPSDIEICATGPLGAMVTYTEPLGTDACLQSSNQTDGSFLTSGSVFPVGVTLIEYTATDASGNFGSCTFNVTINEAPLADFTATTVCEGFTTDFTDQSTIGSGSIIGQDWDFGDGSSNVSGLTPTHLYAAANTYTVTLTATSDLGCTSTSTQSVDVNALPVADFVSLTVCEGVPTQVNDISVGAVSQSWDFGDGNTGTGIDPTNVYATDGTFSVTLEVTDANGCIGQVTNDVVVDAAPAVDFTSSPSCTGQFTQFTNMSDAGADLWDFGTGDFSGFSSPTYQYTTAGTVNVSLEVSGINGCSATLVQAITVGQTPDFTPVVTDVLCFGDNTGAIIITPTVGTPDIFYALDGGTPQLSQAFFDLSSGFYDVSMTDLSGCTSIQTVEVGEPTTSVVGVVPNVSNVTCSNGSDGSFVVAAGGGTSPYSYSLNFGQVVQLSPQFTGLTAGTYDVTIVDDNGCTFDTQADITEPLPVSATVTSTTDVDCNGAATGSALIEATGGSGIFTFSLNSGTPQASGQFNNLLGGSYSVTISDDAGCVDGESFIINEPGLILFSVLNVQNVTCNGLPTGIIEVAAASGTSPFQYAINGGADQPQGVFPGLLAGTYNLTTTDANGCTDDMSVTITENAPLSMVAVAVPATCGGQPTGQVMVTATGGTPSYVYSSNGGQNFVTSPVLGGLNPGNYIVMVADDNGCTVTESVTITGPTDPLVVDAVVQDIYCPGFTNGAITLNASGGTAPYFYSFNNGPFDVVNAIVDLNPGPISWAVVDNNGCLLANFVQISDPNNPIEFNQVIVNDPLCQGDANGNVTVIVFGGNGGYQYSMDNGQTFQADNLLIGYAAGFYNLVVADMNGCTVSQQVELVDPTLVQIAIAGVQNVNCSNEINGAVTLTATGGNPDYVYAIDGGPLQVSNIFNVLGVGTYSVAVSDLNGCIDSTDVTIFAEGLSPIPSFTTLISGEAVQFTNTSQNGLSFLWSFGDGTTSTAISPIHTYAAPGEYDVTLTVTNDCSSESITVPVSTIDIGVNETDLIGLSLYPNPSNGQVQVAHQGAYTGTVDLQITDLTGRILQRKQLNASIGRWNLDLGHLAKGTYLLNFFTQNSSRTLRAEIR